jgi:hypothetical protein
MLMYILNEQGRILTSARGQKLKIFRGSKFQKFLQYKHIFFIFLENIHNYKGIF